MAEFRLQDRKAVLTGGGRGLGRAIVRALAEEGADVAFLEEAAEALGGLGASKAALVMATRRLAVALAPRIRVNAVAPGMNDPPGADDSVRRRIPAGRFGTSAEVVEAVLFLLAGGGYTTGQVLCVDGGRALV